MGDDLENIRLAASRLLRNVVDAHTPLVELRPRPEDYARVFAPALAAAARDHLEQLWQTTPELRLRPDQTELRVHAATVDDLRSGTAKANAFPGGYRKLAPFLTDGHIWICWDVVAPGAGAGMSFDGLVPLDDRWAWFPKPWRALSREKAPAGSHWTD